MNEEERAKELARLTELAERPKKANLANREIYRWILELVRNCMVVAALWYLATKSGDWWLWAIAVVAGFVLMSYCYTYVENIWFDWKVPHTGWQKHLSIIVGTLVTQLILIGITAGLFMTLNKIVSVQMLNTKGP